MDVVRRMESFGAKDGSGVTSSTVVIENSGMVREKEAGPSAAPKSSKDLARAAAKVEFLKAAAEGCGEEEIKKRAGAAFQKSLRAQRATAEAGTPLPP
jgi:hypothetical protein